MSVPPLVPEGGRPPPRRQRVAAYAVIVRDGRVLLTRISPRVSPRELWTLPGGGIEFGEPPADAVVREVFEETGLPCTLGEPLWVGSARRVVDRGADTTDLHSVRIVYDAWVPPDAGEPSVVEVDGSTAEARWVPLEDVSSGAVPTVPMVLDALARYRPATRQRVAAYALVVRDDDAVLLTRHSGRGPRPGTWTLPGGGLGHGESPAQAVTREVREETGLEATVGRLLGVHDEHFTGTAPNGREEDYHGVHLIFDATVDAGEPTVQDPAGTTDEARWVPLDEVTDGLLPVATVVTAALRMRRPG